jgi:hypothetical protein
MLVRVSTSKFAIVLRGTLSQDNIVDAESLLGQVRGLELLRLVVMECDCALVRLRISTPGRNRISAKVR